MHEATPSVVADVFHALAVGEELNALDETARVRRAAEHVAGAVRVAEGKRELNGLGIDEIASRLGVNVLKELGKNCTDLRD